MGLLFYATYSMQKYLLIFSLIALASQHSYAQKNRFGMKSGVAFSSISQQETEIGLQTIEWEGKTAYQTGLFYNRRLETSVLSFQFEVDYKKLGTKFRVNEVDPRIDPSVKAEYEFENIGFSVLPRIDLMPNQKFNPNFMIGGVIEFQTNSTVTFTSNLPDTARSLNNFFFGGDINKNTEKILYGYIMAGGVEIATKPVIITLEGRFTSLFTKVFNEEVNELPFNGQTSLLKIVENSRHNYFSFLIGFNFYF